MAIMGEETSWLQQNEPEPPTNPLRSPDGFKLGVFSTNADGGLALTTVPERWKATWPDNVAAARIADEGGFDFFLPIARWAGFGGETHAREWSFETFTWAAGLAALTRRMAIFSTVHVPLVHPIYRGESAGDGRSHLRRTRRPQHRLRLEPEGIRHVRHDAGRARLRPRMRNGSRSSSAPMARMSRSTSTAIITS